jgi:ribosomal RNA-processing protein 17
MFFAQPRAKKRPTVERPFYRKKRKTQIEEIEFKPDDREEYLTGFRKRKQQRVKLAQAEAAKKAREARNESRRKVSRMAAARLDGRLRGLRNLGMLTTLHSCERSGGSSSRNTSSRSVSSSRSRRRQATLRTR